MTTEEGGLCVVTKEEEDEVAVDEETVQRKADELLRLYRVRCPPGVGDSGLCTRSVCAEIAARLLKAPFNKEKAVASAGCREKTYNDTLNAVCNVLDIRLEVDMKELCRAFGAGHYCQAATTVVEDYKKALLASIPASQLQSIDLSSPAYAGVALYLCSKQKKIRPRVKIDRKKLMLLAECNPDTFRRVAKSMIELCFPDIKAKREKEKAARLASSSTSSSSFSSASASASASSSSSSASASASSTVRSKRKREKSEEEDDLKDFQPERQPTPKKKPRNNKKETAGEEDEEKRRKKEEHERWVARMKANSEQLAAKKGGAKLKQATLNSLFSSPTVSTST
ncbi:Origin of replication complex subunit 6 [Balamuthia mandrillaris]